MDGYPVTVITRDAGPDDGTYQGELFLAGQPCNFGEGYSGDVTCEFCDGFLDEIPNHRTGLSRRGSLSDGDHLGVVVFWFSPVSGVNPMPMQAVHHRCLMDLASDGAIGYITEGAEYPASGRHLASA
jgi:hypothetical protein